MFKALLLEPIDFLQMLEQLYLDSGLSKIEPTQIIMLLISFVLIYLAIVKKFEPLLLLPIAFGMFLANIPGASEVLLAKPHGDNPGGLLYYLNKGVEWVIFPPLIFLGIGAMTDFGPMIANPKSILLGAASQIGIFVTYIVAMIVLGKTGAQAAAIGIIGGADGPTAIYVAAKLYSDKLTAIAIAAYSYMALIPIIQPPIMRLLTTKEERSVRMEQLRKVSKAEKIIYPIVVTAIVGILLPGALPLLGMLMLGNLMRESGVVERLAKTASNEFINIITIILGVCVGAKANYHTFENPQDWLDALGIIALGLVAFSIATASGVLFGKLMYKLTGGKVNPLIGSAGVSAVPMAARVSEIEGLREDPENHLLMHAMGPNVAGVIGSAIAAGVFLSFYAV